MEEDNSSDVNKIKANGNAASNKEINDDEIKQENDEECVVKPKWFQPSQPKCTAKRSDREKARQWRKKKLVNGVKIKDSDTSNKETKSEIKCGKDISKNRKEPLPMRKRAFPESFWREPVTMQTSSLAGNVYPVLPPLFSSDNNNTDMTEIRPVTPPGATSRKKDLKTPSRYFTSQPDTDLLFSLFDQFENKVDEKRLVRRGRPKKQPGDKSIYTHPPKREDDPYMVDSLSEKLFPQLSLNGSNVKVDKYAIIKLPSNGRTVELPAIQLENNYSVMLNELTMHL